MRYGRHVPRHQLVHGRHGRESPSEQHPLRLHVAAVGRTVLREAKPTLPEIQSVVEREFHRREPLRCRSIISFEVLARHVDFASVIALLDDEAC